LRKQDRIIKIKNTEIRIVKKSDKTVFKSSVFMSPSDIPIPADEISLRSFVGSTFLSADKLKIKEVIFLDFDCLKSDLNVLSCAKIIAQEVYRHLRQGTSGIRRIFFYVRTDEAFEIFQKGINSYLTHITEVLQSGPFITVDAIIEVAAKDVKNGIVVIKRSNPPFGWALPGGFVDYGESLEEAVKREAKEETNLDINCLQQFHTYSDPSRDPRFHTIGTVFIAKAKGIPKAGDDAAAFKVISPDEIEQMHFAFDHKKILTDYLQYKQKTD